MSTVSQVPVEVSEATWRVPECPFPIEWSAPVMEEIRLAVVEAFFSLPHGGAEIGGVLFGTRSGGCVHILAHRPVACEHALGPSFTFSEKDHATLRALLDEGTSDLREQGLEPVGWYHSHTRSEIFLSPQDLAIHNRYFPDPWQVALVLRPHALKPVRAGFFFRETGGYVHTDASYGEFQLRPAPSSAKPPVEQPLVPLAVSPPADVPVPAFLTVVPRKRSWRWLWALAIVLPLAAGLFAYKQGWIPDLSRHQAPSLSLMAYDVEGHVQIHWDRAAEPIRTAAAGTLEITDGAASTVIKLDQELLQRGNVSYARQTSRVNVRLAVNLPGRKEIEEFASVLGHPPASKPATDPSADTEALRKELHDQMVRTRRLERVVGDLRTEIRREHERQQADRQPNP